MTSPRVFKLREKIPARYEQVSGADLMSRVMQTPSQAGFDLSEQAAASTEVDQSEVEA